MDPVNFLFKEWQISQAYHIPRYAVYLLLGKQKLFIGVKIASDQVRGGLGGCVKKRKG